MNPYSVTNPLNPTFTPNAQVPGNRSSDGHNDGDFDPAVSRAAYRLFNTVDQLLFKRGR